MRKQFATLAEKSGVDPAMALFGNNAQASVVKFFLKNQAQDFSSKEIASGARIGRTTLWESKILETLLDIGLIVKTRSIGNASLFRFNSDSAMGKLLSKVYRVIEDNESKISKN